MSCLCFPQCLGDKERLSIWQPSRRLLGFLQEASKSLCGRAHCTRRWCQHARLADGILRMPRSRQRLAEVVRSPPAAPRIPSATTPRTVSKSRPILPPFGNFLAKALWPAIHRGLRHLSTLPVSLRVLVNWNIVASHKRFHGDPTVAVEPAIPRRSTFWKVRKSGVSLVLL